MKRKFPLLSKIARKLEGFPRGRFINASEYFWNVTNYRVVNIRGHVGSGKTLLSVATGYELWEQGYIDHIYAPFPVKGQRNKYDKYKKFVMLLDEAHVVLDSRKFGQNNVEEWLRDIRKRQAIIITSAFIDVDKRMRSVVVQRTLLIGSLFWMYRWQIDDGIGVSTGTFGLLFPNWYFGLYDTLYSPSYEDFENMRIITNGDNKRDDSKSKRKDATTVSFITDEEIHFKKQIEVDKITLSNFFHRSNKK